MGAAVNKNLWRVYIEVGHKNKLVSMVTKSRALNLFDNDFPMPDYIVQLMTFICYIQVQIELF